MIDFKELTLDDRKLIEEYYGKCKYMGSETNFTNMFMWSRSYNIRYAETDGFMVIAGSHGDIRGIYHFPVGSGDLKAVLLKLERELPEFTLCPVTDEMIDKIEEVLPGHYDFEHLRSADDYVYRTDKLISLSGKKLHSKRNHYNYFINNYDYEYRSLTAESAEECCAAVCKWIYERNSSPEEEAEATRRIFGNMNRLNIKGGYILCEGSVAAVTLGEYFHGSALIHIEKCDMRFRGVYAAINKLFLEHEFSECEYVNREEDMGIEGLRKAKLSYNPAFLIKKYAAHRRESI